MFCHKTLRNACSVCSLLQPKAQELSILSPLGIAALRMVIFSIVPSYIGLRSIKYCLSVCPENVDLACALHGILYIFFMIKRLHGWHRASPRGA